MKVLPSFETSLTVYQSARGNTPHDVNLMQHHCKNLKYRQLRVSFNEDKSNASCWYVAGCEEEGSISKSIEHNPYGEADSRSVGKEVTCVLRRPNVHYTGSNPGTNQNSYLVSLRRNAISYFLPTYVLCPGRVVIFSLPKLVQNHTGAQPTTYLLGTGCYFPWRKAAVFEGEKSYPPNAVIKNEWCSTCTSLSPHLSMTPRLTLGQLYFSFPYHPCLPSDPRTELSCGK